MQLRRSTVLIVLAALLAGCSVRSIPSEPPNPPSGTPVPPSASATTVPPTATSAPAPSPVPVAPAGTFDLTCLDAAPAPIEPGSLACELVRRDPAGEVLPGWPVELGGPCADAVADGAGTIFVGCATAAGTAVLAFEPDGSERAGWRAEVPWPLAPTTWNDFSFGCGRHQPALAVATDGTVFVAGAAGADTFLTALDGTGATMIGWPQELPGDGTAIAAEVGPCVGFTLAPDGTVRAWGYEGVPPDEGGLGYFPFAERTVYTAIDRQGRTIPGWPVGSQGTGSGPIVGPDGVLFHVTEAGNLWGHDAAAQPVAAAPHDLERPVAPLPTTDGRLLFVLDNEGGAELLSFAPGGGLQQGSAAILGGHRQSRCLATDVDCFGYVDPLLGQDGTLYLSMAAIVDRSGGRVIAVGRAGEGVPGWPLQLEPGEWAHGLSTDDAGNIVVDLSQCDDVQCETIRFATLLVSPAGQVLEETGR